MMKHNRVLCVYIPHFRVLAERLRRPAFIHLPVLVHDGGRRPVVIEGCGQAAEVGVREGMLLSRALSLCPRAVPIPADEDYYRQLHRQTLLPLLRLTPEVASPALGLAFMGVRGLDRLVGDENTLARLVLQEWKKGELGALMDGDGEGELSGSGVRVGIAGGHFAAAMAALHGGKRICIVVPGREAACLATLPLEVLPAPDSDWREMLRRLRLLGLHTLGDLAGLGKVAAQAQFGLPGLEAWRLATNDADYTGGVFGGAEIYRSSLLMPEVEARRQFEPALVSLSDLETALGWLAEEVAGRLRREGWSCVSLRVTWQVESGGEGSREVSLKEPTALAQALLSAARRALEGAIREPVAELKLRVEALSPQTGRQLSLFEKRKARQRLVQVATELQKRLGKAVLLRVQPLGPSHLEERTYAFAADL
jgi:nucleotidyltransferase/DNA polymerase involved in DNA repair